MDMEINLGTSDVRWNSKPKKKYELSLKKLRNKLRTEIDGPVKRETERRLQDEIEESGDSENFRLQLSESFGADDTCESFNEKVGKAADNKAQEVILISDSSDDGTPEKSDSTKFKWTASARGGIRKSTSAPNCVYIVKSSDSEENDIRRGKSSPRADSVNKAANDLQRKCSIAYTSDEDSSEAESEIFSYRRENVLYRANKSDEPCETASKYFQDSEKKLNTLTERFRDVFRNENCVESESGVNGDKRENILYIGNRDENKSRVTPTTTRNDQDRKIFSSERFRGIFNDKSRPDTDSGISSTKRGNIFDAYNEKNNASHVTPTTKNGPNSGKKFISSSERYRGNFTEASRLDTDSGIDSVKRGNFYNRINDKENTSRTTPKVPKNDQKTARKLISSSERFRGILTDNACNIDTRENGKISSEIVVRAEEPKRTPLLAKILAQRTPGQSDASKKPEESLRTPISAKITSTTIPSSKDTQKLLQSIRSSRYETPKVREKPCEVNDAVALSESENLSPESTRRDVNTEAREPIVIAETDSDSETEKVIQGSRLDELKPHKTHVTRFLDPAISEDALSEKKKLEVAKWLLTSAADSRSDSSLSNISGTQGGSSPSSGNSSLERLEQNYETPNNRGKLRKLLNVEMPTTTPNSRRDGKSSVRQTRIDDFVMKSGDGKANVLTPVASSVSKKRDLVTPAAKEANLDIMDCADILDNLYGTAWRDKANDLLPSSEPRKAANVPRKDKAVQTERKVNPRSRNVLKKTSESSSSQDDEFDAFVRNIKPNLNSTKKPATTTSRRRCSFLCDSPSSGESGGETTYLTALTNPRISNNLQINRRPTPQSLAIQRARAICDPDTDDEDDNANQNQKGNYRKKLSFSDDEDSSTSEYDPNDEIPPKTIAKPVASKTPNNVYKPSKLPVSKPRLERTKSFLESLCATVPIQEAHPDAKKYRQNFKTTKDELCKHLYKLFNDKVFDNKLPKDMSIEWNVRMRGTAGFCYNKRSIKALGGVTRSSRIVLATKILDTPDRLRDTLVHEMCHAAAWLVNEVSDGHGPFWKGWASKAMKAFPELPAIRRCHDYKIQTKFTYRCTGCGYSVGRHSKSLDIEKKRCGHCYGKFELLMNKVTKSGTVQVRTPTSKQPTGFALFVKENYHSVKKDRQGAPHKEVMQILGQQFSAIKITKMANNADDNNSDTPSKS